MRVAPNCTRVSGWLRNYEPAADGCGGEVVIEVVRNETHDSSTDYIQPEVGQRLRAFYPEPLSPGSRLPIGKSVSVELTYLAGPSGGRVVVRTIETR
jgi:hypothetical protein